MYKHVDVGQRFSWNVRIGLGFRFIRVKVSVAMFGSHNLGMYGAAVYYRHAGSLVSTKPALI